MPFSSFAQFHLTHIPCCGEDPSVTSPPVLWSRKATNSIQGSKLHRANPVRSRALTLIRNVRLNVARRISLNAWVLTYCRLLTYHLSCKKDLIIPFYRLLEWGLRWRKVLSCCRKFLKDIVSRTWFLPPLKGFIRHVLEGLDRDNSSFMLFPHTRVSYQHGRGSEWSQPGFETKI